LRYSLADSLIHSTLSGKKNSPVFSRGEYAGYGMYLNNSQVEKNFKELQNIAYNYKHDK